jgi:hypothetical protein
VRVSIVSDEIARQIDAFNRDRFVVYELSRTIVRPSHRGSGVSRGLMQLGLAHAARFSPAVLIGGCLPEHLAMYARYGYGLLPDTGLDHFDSVGQIAHAVVCRTDLLPQPTRAHVDELLRCLGDGEEDCTLPIARDGRARYRVAEPGRLRRGTFEW